MHNLKPYFAKYLPVEGELEDKDFFLWREEVHQFHSDAGYGIKTYTYYNPEDGSSLLVNWSNCRGKVKLFLCSRDIQVGDKVRSLEFLEDTDFYPVTEQTFGFLVRKGIKVIGEISLEAIWVKEGGEFEEDEWRNSRKADGCTYVDYDKNFTGKEGYVIEIRCPTCKKFH